MLMQLTVSGLSQGAIYALIALSLTVVFRATTVVNFGHGDFVLGGAFGVYVLVVMLGLPFLPSAIAAIALMFACGILISRGFIDPIKAGPHIGFAMMSISLARYDQQQSVRVDHFGLEHGAHDRLAVA